MNKFKAGDRVRRRGEDFVGNVQHIDGDRVDVCEGSGLSSESLRLKKAEEAVDRAFEKRDQ